jgi:hypothetical protein
MHLGIERRKRIMQWSDERVKTFEDSPTGMRAWCKEVDSFYQESTSIATAITRTVPCMAEKMWVTAELIGGTSPTVTGTIYVRPTYSGSLTNTKLTLDSTNNLYVRGVEYDPASGASKTALVRDLSDQYLQETLCVLSSTNVVAANYDIDMRGYTTLSLVLYGQSDTAGVNLVYVAFQQCNDTNSATPRYATITGSVFDASTNAVLVPDASGNITLPTAAVGTYCLYLTDIACHVIRVRVTLAASTDTDNKLEIYSFKKGAQ